MANFYEQTGLFQFLLKSGHFGFSPIPNKTYLNFILKLDAYFQFRDTSQGNTNVQMCMVTRAILDTCTLEPQTIFAKCAGPSDLTGDNRVSPIRFVRMSDQVSETKIQEIMKKC